MNCSLSLVFEHGKPRGQERPPPLASALEAADQPASLLRLRSLDDGIFNASRYFAIVRRATLIPSFDRIRAIWLSLSGFSGSSAATSLRILARTAVDDCSPSSLARWLEKK